MLQYRYDLSNPNNPYNQNSNFCYLLVKAIVYNTYDIVYKTIDFALPVRTESEAFKYIELQKDYIINWIDDYTQTLFGIKFENKKIIFNME